LAQADQSVTYRESAEPKSLFFLVQVGFFRLQFVLELPGEVIKEVVPTHSQTVAMATDISCPVLHRSRIPLYYEESFWFSGLTPRT
jgi:hypothetical protein